MFRYLILRDIDKVNLSEWSRRKHHVRLVVCFCVVSSLLLHLPYFFQTIVVPCDDEEEPEWIGKECWTHATSSIMDEVWWKVYGYAYQVLVKGLPFVLIFSLNIAMVVKLRKVWRQRRELKERSRAKLEEHRRRRMAMTAEVQVGVTNRISVISGNTLTVPDMKTGSKTLSDELTLTSELPTLSRKPSIYSTFENSSNSNASQNPPRSDAGSATQERRKNRRKKKIALFGLPSKESRRELKLSILLIVMAISHGVLTTPGNISYFMYTNFPEAWAKFEGASIYRSVANSLNAVKYAKNFYLYCVTNPEISAATAALFKTAFRAVCARGKSSDIAH